LKIQTGSRTDLGITTLNAEVEMIVFVAALLLLAPTEKALTTEPQKEAMICRREVPIGSLIASRKICLTKDQWQRRIADGNEEARKMVYDNMSRPNDGF
jgi:hypothetical protein